MIYAQLNEESICIGVSQLSGKIENEKMIEIESYDTSLLGKKYMNENWEEVKQLIPQEPQPTEQELLNAEFLLNQTEQSAKLKQIDEAIAVLLINQNGGM